MNIAGLLLNGLTLRAGSLWFWYCSSRYLVRAPVRTAENFNPCRYCAVDFKTNAERHPLIIIQSRCHNILCICRERLHESALVGPIVLHGVSRVKSLSTHDTAKIFKWNNKIIIYIIIIVVIIIIKLMEMWFLTHGYKVLVMSAVRSKSSSAIAATIYYSEATLVSFI